MFNTLEQLEILKNSESLNDAYTMEEVLRALEGMRKATESKLKGQVECEMTDEYETYLYGNYESLTWAIQLIKAIKKDK